MQRTCDPATRMDSSHRPSPPGELPLVDQLSGRKAHRCRCHRRRHKPAFPRPEKCRSTRARLPPEPRIACGGLTLSAETTKPREQPQPPWLDPPPSTSISVVASPASRRASRWKNPFPTRHLMRTINLALSGNGRQHSSPGNGG